MYVCLCKGITDHQIRAEVDDGADSLIDVSRRLGVATQCGKCAGCARQVIREAVACRDEACREIGNPLPINVEFAPAV